MLRCVAYLRLNWLIQYEYFTFQIPDLQRLHKERHRQRSRDHNAVCTTNAHVSIDGVRESNSTSRSLHCYSIKFKGCYKWYLFAVVRGATGIKPDHSIQLCRAIQDFLHASLKVEKIRADAPERAFLRMQVNHNGAQACDLCILHAAFGRCWPPVWGDSGDGPGTEIRRRAALRTLEDLHYVIDNFDDLNKLCRYNSNSNYISYFN